MHSFPDSLSTSAWQSDQSPRYVQPNQYADSSHTLYSGKVRLVSNTGPDKKFDYVLGLFYESDRDDGSWTVSEPGVPERAAAQGCTGPSYIGASFPNCQSPVGPGDTNFYQSDSQHFQDRSVFGELTWHISSHGQLTVGGRHFEQSFDDTQTYNLYTYSLISPPTTRNLPASKNTWKVNPSYEYAVDQYVYALWSQGFRRGGANALATESFYKDNPVLLTYSPDSIDNYEAGLKGHFTSGFSYSIDVFNDVWHNPQVGGELPDGNVAVWNATKAKSTGVEFDITSPLFFPGLSIKASGAYTNARFTEDYFYVADAFGDISGKAGQQLPGSSKVSAAATLAYERRFNQSDKLSLSLNDTYHSAMPLSTFPILGETGVLTTAGMNIINASAAITHGAWLGGLYVTNLTDKRLILTPGTLTPSLGNLGTEETINQPRAISLRVRYSF